MEVDEGLYGLPRKLLLGEESGSHNLSEGQKVAYAIAACLFVCGSGIASGVWGFLIARNVFSALRHHPQHTPWLVSFEGSATVA
jgi:hypothetical protein